MFLAYYDETGDDGYPKTSSPLFVLTAVYMHHQVWKENFYKVHQFKKDLATQGLLPFDLELHTHQLLLKKKPYTAIGLTNEKRKEVISAYCTLLANLNCRIVNVIINKTIVRRPNYAVLDKAFTYSIQRIENDLSRDGNRFLIISDEGRVGKMRKTARRIQRFNPIPSHFKSSSYRKEIEYLIEDPLPKRSQDSYFIQFADMVSCLVFFWMGLELGVKRLPQRITSYVGKEDVQGWLDILKPSLNLMASSNPYGIVCYPKP